MAILSFGVCDIGRWIDLGPFSLWWYARGYYDWTPFYSGVDSVGLEVSLGPAAILWSRSRGTKAFTEGRSQRSPNVVHEVVRIYEGLTFERLRQVNVGRCEQVFHKLDDWSATDWGVALGGEIGEAVEALGKLLTFLNDVKKLRRLDNADASKDTPEERARLISKVVEEIADGVIYADLVCAHLRRDLGMAVREKFNRVSVERGSTFRL